MQAQTQLRSKGKIALLVGGIVLAIVALVGAAVGGTAIWADTTQKDSHGYMSTSRHDFRSPSRAITTERIDIGTDVPEWLFGKIRIEAANRDSARPVFVGIARTSDVDAYFAGVDRAVVTDLDFDPFKVTYARHPGAKSPAAPASQSFWAVSTQGSGTRSLTWATKSGKWSVVVMNADGSAGVDADVSAGAKVPYALWFGIGFVLAGALLFFGAALMIVSGRRRKPGPPPPVAQPVPSA
jgi:hypothetical protein